MEVSKRCFPKIMLDNESAYFGNLLAVIESVDELSCVEITRTTHSYFCRVAPSIPKYAQSILHEILKLNTIYGIQLDLSKSIRTSSTISFNIELPE
jgi:hypothetical protein